MANICAYEFELVKPLCADELDYPYATVHNMIMDYQAMTKAILAKTQETQAQLATRLHVSQPSVSRWVNGGEPELKHTILIEKEARRLRILNYKSNRALPTVEIVGYVGAGGTINFRDGQGPFGEAEMPPNAEQLDMVAVVVQGDSMAGLMEDGSLLYYSNRREPPEPELFGKLCVVGLQDGSVLIKKLYPGRKAKHYDLHSLNAPALMDQPVEWAARVRWIAPK